MPRRTSYPLSKILDAFNASATGHTVGKIVIEMPAVPEVSAQTAFERLMKSESMGSCDCYNSCVARTIEACCICSDACTNNHDLQVECENDAECKASGACPAPKSVLNV